MLRRLTAAALALLIALPLAAQTPAGWKVRADRSTAASDPDAAGAIKFAVMDKGLHATNPQAAVFWNPAHSTSGSYTVKGTFTLVRPSDHVNYYGIVFGGSELEGPNQSYMYFLIGQDGTWLVKHRAGDAVTHNVAAKTPNDAVKKPDANGTSTNALEVRVGAEKVDFVVNGTVVHSIAKAGTPMKTDGIYGIRVNHRLEVHIDGFGMTK